MRGLACKLVIRIQGEKCYYKEYSIQWEHIEGAPNSDSVCCREEIKKKNLERRNLQVEY